MTADDVRALFARLDQLDADALVSAMAPGGEVIFGNNPPARGPEAIRSSRRSPPSTACAAHRIR
ncbi:MAG: hypothetical protein AAF602_04670 [Myxococcota bacterium]